MESIHQQIIRQKLTIIKQLVTKDENGALPSKSQSDYLRLISKDNNEFFNKVKEAYSTNRISEKTFIKIKNIINNQSIHDNNYELKLYIENELKPSPNIFNGFTVLNLDKLQNLISYIASKTKLYLTSLNKYLWFIDMISYNKRAVSITGLIYVHEKYGPVIIHRKYEEISNLSHQELAWKNTKRFQKISFEYADNLNILNLN